MTSDPPAADQVSVGDQLSLDDLPAAAARSRAKAARRSGSVRPPQIAEYLPIARVAVDISLPHLDRPFDYQVTEAQSEAARPGVRVRVRFSGQLVDGFVLDRVATTEHSGRLTPLSSVVSAEQVLTPEVLALARAVADHTGGVLADVLRLAVPPRHAAVEREPRPEPGSIGAGLPGADPRLARARERWEAYRRGPQLVAAVAEGRAPRAGWCALPGVEEGTQRWTLDVAALVGACAQSGRGAIIVVPDGRDVDRVGASLSANGVAATALTADLGPRERYRRWLSILRGETTVVVGTRAAVWAPVRDLGLVIVWDDGDDVHVEPRTPSPHVRDVAALRAHHQRVSLVVGGYHRTTEVAAMVQRGFLQSVVADRPTVRAAAPRVQASGDALSDRDPQASAARLPSAAWRVARDALGQGPVLVQVPRRGFAPALACDRCRHPARCQSCAGPLGLSLSGGVPTCRWCSTPATRWRCDACGHERTRAVVVGAQRTADELGRAFPGVPVITSGGRAVLDDVGSSPALVVATPGAEPVPSDGYAAALLLDAWALLGRADLRADEETVRRWMTAASLVRPAVDGGRVMVVADAGLRAVQGLVRWDPVRFAELTLDERRATGLPPARRLASLRGTATTVATLLQSVELPAGATLIGTSPVEGSDPRSEDVSALISVEPTEAGVLAARIRAAQGALSARRVPFGLLRMDPLDLP